MLIHRLHDYNSPFGRRRVKSLYCKQDKNTSQKVIFPYEHILNIFTIV